MPAIITSHEVIIAGMRTNFQNGCLGFCGCFHFNVDGYSFSLIIIIT